MPLVPLMPLMPPVPPAAYQTPLNSSIISIA